MTSQRLTLDEKVWPKIDASGDCWEWTAAVFANGYGRVRQTEGGVRRGLLAHRAVWELLVGPIEQGMQLDHRCLNRGCVNPDHLEVVTLATNVLRGYGPSAANARKALCGKGHALTDSNIYYGKSRSGNRSRTCRTCKLAWMARKAAA